MTRFWPQLWQSLVRDPLPGRHAASSLENALSLALDERTRERDEAAASARAWRIAAGERGDTLLTRTAERDRARDTAVTLHADTVQLEAEVADLQRRVASLVSENTRLAARNAAANRIITGLLADDNPTVARAIADGEVWLQSGVTA